MISSVLYSTSSLSLIKSSTENDLVRWDAFIWKKKNIEKIYEKQVEDEWESLLCYFFQEKIMIALNEVSFGRTDQDKWKWYSVVCLGKPYHRVL